MNREHAQKVKEIVDRIFDFYCENDDHNKKIERIIYSCSTANNAYDALRELLNYLSENDRWGISLSKHQAKIWDIVDQSKRQEWLMRSYYERDIPF